jgi:hypothetical protein
MESLLNKSPGSRKLARGRVQKQAAGMGKTREPAGCLNSEKLLAMVMPGQAECRRSFHDEQEEIYFD